MLDDIPAMALAIVAAVLPTLVEPGMRDLYQLPKTLWMTWTAPLLVALVGALGLFAGRRILWPRRMLLTWPALAMAATIVIGVVIAPTETGGVLSHFAKMDLYRWVAAYMIFGVAVVAITRPRRLIFVLAGLLLGGVIVSVWGIAEHYEIDALLPKGHNRWKGINRPGSSFGNRNMAAQLIASVVPAGYVFWAMGVRWWLRGRDKTQALLLSCGGLAPTGLLLWYLRLSVTRSAMAGTALGMVGIGALLLLAWLMATRSAGDAATADDDEAGAGADDALPDADASVPVRSSWKLIGAQLALVALLGGGVVGGLAATGHKPNYDEGIGDQKRKQSVAELVSTVTDFDKPHWKMRVMMWRTTWAAIQARPFGGGAGNWRVLYPQYLADADRTDNDHFTIAKQPVRAHNDFLQFASEYGIVGGLALIALLLVATWLTLQAVVLSRQGSLLGHDPVHWAAWGALAGWAGLVGIAGDALLSFPLQLPSPTFLFMLHLGLIGACHAYIARVDANQAADPTAAPPQVLQAADVYKLPTAALIVVLLTGVVATGFARTTNDRQLQADRHFTRARALQKRGNPSAGLTEIQSAIAINSDDFQNHFIEALCYNSMGNREKNPTQRQTYRTEAVESIKRSLALYPNLLNAWVNLAMFSAKANDDDEMNRAVDAALALKPDEVVALNVRARWLRARGQWQQIVDELGPHLQANKGNGTFLDHLITAARELDNWSLAADALGHQATLADDKVIKQPTAAQRAVMSGKQRAAADRSFQRALADKNRKRVQAHTEHGEALTRAGRHDDAVLPLKTAAELAGPKATDAKHRYVIALARAAAVDRARHEIAVAINSAKPGGKWAERQRIIDDLRKAADTAKDKAAVEGLVAWTEGRFLGLRGK